MVGRINSLLDKHNQQITEIKDLTAQINKFDEKANDKMKQLQLKMSIQQINETSSPSLLYSFIALLQIVVIAFCYVLVTKHSKRL